MKEKKFIAKLDEMKGSIPFPQKEPQTLRSFEIDLFHVLDANGLEKGWEWDPYDQHYYIRWHDSDGIYIAPDGATTTDYTRDDVTRLGIEITQSAYLWPTRPLADEIARLIREHEAFKGRCRVIVRGALAGLRGAEQTSDRGREVKSSTLGKGA